MMSACSVSFPALFFLFDDQKKKSSMETKEHYSSGLLNAFKIYEFCIFVNCEINVLILTARILQKYTELHENSINVISLVCFYIIIVGTQLCYPYHAPPERKVYLEIHVLSWYLLFSIQFPAQNSNLLDFSLSLFCSSFSKIPAKLPEV